jgi:hypothetical protein
MAEEKRIMEIAQVILQKEGAVSYGKTAAEENGGLKQIHSRLIRQLPYVFG